jgi:hypothetical protein
VLNQLSMLDTAPGVIDAWTGTAWAAISGGGGGGGGAAETGWSVTAGYTVDKSFNPQDTTLNELASVLGSLIDALIRHGELAP